MFLLSVYIRKIKKIAKPKNPMNVYVPNARKVMHNKHLCTQRDRNNVSNNTVELQWLEQAGTMNICSSQW